nr:hypothetical protein [Chenggangzhangella methanolivorans]
MIIFVNTGLDFLAAAGTLDRKAHWFQIARGLGSTPIALLVAVLVGTYVLGVRRGKDSPNSKSWSTARSGRSAPSR